MGAIEAKSNFVTSHSTDVKRWISWMAMLLSNQASLFSVNAALMVLGFSTDINLVLRMLG
jgi:hypothetical protein